jgi:hypothetical protein
MTIHRFISNSPVVQFQFERARRPLFTNGVPLAMPQPIGVGER